jgi:hypothetical protein
VTAFAVGNASGGGRGICQRVSVIDLELCRIVCGPYVMIAVVLVNVAVQPARQSSEMLRSDVWRVWSANTCARRGVGR